jgi:transposase-like protein
MKGEVKLKDGRTIRRYSESVKLKILDEIHSGRMTKNEASRQYDVSVASIYKWMRKFGRLDLYNPRVTIQMPTEKDKIKALKEEIAVLKEAMIQSQLKAIKAESDLEVALEMMGLNKSSFEKKQQAPHSKKPSRKDGK